MIEFSQIQDVSVLHLYGEVSLFEMEHLSRLIDSIKKTGSSKILLDLAQTDHIHYKVFQICVEKASHLRKENGDIKLVGAGLKSGEIFKFTGADQHLEDYASLADGILSFLTLSSMETRTAPSKGERFCENGRSHKGAWSEVAIH